MENKGKTLFTFHVRPNAFSTNFIDYAKTWFSNVYTHIKERWMLHFYLFEREFRTALPNSSAVKNPPTLRVRVTIYFLNRFDRRDS